MAIYGHKNWVNGYHDHQIFLNRKLIDDDKLNLTEVQNKAAEFIAQFSGIARVTTDQMLHTGTWNAEMAGFYYGTYAKGRGDLLISLQPGWKINNENPGEPVKQIRNNAVRTPLVLMGNGIKPQHLYRTIKATEVAPTVTHILRIRPPNACQDIPLYEIDKR